MPNLFIFLFCQIVLSARVLSVAAEPHVKHMQFAVAAGCDYYLTTDKKLLNTPVPEIKIINLIIQSGANNTWTTILVSEN